MVDTRTHLRKKAMEAGQAHQAGQYQLALSLYEEILSERADWFDIWHQYAHALYHSGHQEDCLKALDTAWQGLSDQPDFLNNFASITHEYGNHNAAFALWQDALAILPSHKNSILGMSAAYRLSRQNDKAIPTLKTALDKHPHDPDLSLQLFLCLKDTDDEDALRLLSDSFDDHPEHPDIALYLADAYRQDGQTDKAHSIYKKAILHQPENGFLYANCASLMIITEHFAQGLDFIERALKLLGQQPALWLTKASLLERLDQDQSATDLFEHILHLQPDNDVAWANLGHLYVKHGRLEEAHHCYHQACRLSPGSMRYIFDRGLNALRQGFLPEGYDGYNAGFECNERFPAPPSDIPIWNGSLDFQGTLFVSAEQGLGDEIANLSVLNDLIATNANIIWEADPRLQTILKRSFHTVTFVPRQAHKAHNRESLKAYSSMPIDACYPAGSLRQIFRPTLECYQKQCAYLFPDPERQHHYHDILSALKSRYSKDKVIGFNMTSGLVNKRRSIYLTEAKDWSHFTPDPSAIYINLCHAMDDDDCAHFQDEAGFALIHLSGLDLFNDLEGLLACMSQMDHIITVGTSISDFAGSIGAPTDLLCPSVAPLLLGQDFVPLYPNHVLIPRHAPQSWAHVIDSFSSFQKKQ